jgi:copper(I)-binding protein
MKMMEVEEGFAVPAGGSHALARGGDHVMLMGLTRDLADGDTFPLTLVFEKSGEVVIEVPVDNARKPEAAMQHGEGQGMGAGGHSGHGMAHGG